MQSFKLGLPLTKLSRYNFWRVRGVTATLLRDNFERRKGPIELRGFKSIYSFKICPETGIVDPEPVNQEFQTNSIIINEVKEKEI